MINNPVLGNGGNPSGVEFVQNFIPQAIGLGFVAGTVIFFFMLLFGAIQWISSGGDKQGLEGARSKVTNAIIGLVILFSLWVVLNLINGFFNIKIMRLDIGPLVIQ